MTFARIPVESLRDLGYRVIEAHDGPSALRLLERAISRGFAVY